MRTAAVGPRAAALAAGLLYAGVLAWAPRLNAVALAAAAPLMLLPPLAAALAARGRGGDPVPPWTLAAFWPAAHTAMLATGGIPSPLLPLLAGWLLLATTRLRPRALLLAAAALITLLLVGERERDLGAPGALRVVLLTGLGLAPLGWTLLQRHRAGMAATLDPAVLWPRQPAAEGGAGPRLEEIRRMVEEVRHATAADRAVLWLLDPVGERAAPWMSVGGPDPRSLALRGDPMQWAAEEGVAMRLERTPAWAIQDARVTLAPVETDYAPAVLLSLEHGSAERAVAPEALGPHAAVLRAALGFYRREAAALEDKDRYRRLLDMLRALPAELAGGDYAKQLAASAAQLVGGTGGLVALWDAGAEEGSVLALVGDDGGPVPGTRFEPGESELALAARGEAPLERQDLRAARRTPLAAAGERWLAAPRTLVAMPLTDAQSGVVGVLAVWTSERSALDPDSLDALRSVLPYAAVQLEQSLEFESVRAHAERDALTSLPNRRAFELRFDEETSRYHRYPHPLALLLIDLDHFKQVNDQLGHEAGDEVLRSVGATLLSGVREVDHVARYGGEEFVVLMPETPLRKAIEAAERLRRRIEDLAVEWNGRTIPVRASVGVSAAPECVPDPDRLIGSADAALYASKSAGRNRVTPAPATHLDL